MIKIFAVVIISLTAILFLKNTGREYSIILSFAVVIFLFAYSVNDLSSILTEIIGISDGVENLTPYIKLLIKILGISLAAQFTADLCRDCGENALASQTEIISKIVILIMIIPLFKTMINIVTGLLK